MANRETYPASQSPLQGDISGPAGAVRVTVTGLQNNPVQASTPNEQSVLTWDEVLGEWVPQIPAYTIVLNGTPDSQDVLLGFIIISDDWEISINGVGTEVLSNWTHGYAYQVFVNGTGVVGSSQ